MFVQVQSLCSTSNSYVDWTNTKNMCKTVEINTTDSSYGSKFWAELIIYWRRNLWDWELHENRAAIELNPMSSNRWAQADAAWGEEPPLGASPTEQKK